MGQGYMDTITPHQTIAGEGSYGEAPLVLMFTVECTVGSPQLTNNNAAQYILCLLSAAPSAPSAPSAPCMCVCGQWPYCTTLGLHKHNQPLMLPGQQQTSPLLTCSVRLMSEVGKKEKHVTGKASLAPIG